MKPILAVVLIILLAGCQLRRSSFPQADSPASLATSSPEEQGMRSGDLLDMLSFVQRQNVNVNSIVIARNGKTVLDAHFYPNKGTYVHDVASVTKSITSVLAGIAIDKGFIANELQRVSSYFSEHAALFDTELKRRLVIKDLLTMTSGLCADFADGERQLEEMRLSSRPIEYILSQELVSKPGERFAYCSCATQLLSAIIQKATGKKMEAFARQVLLQPLGIEEYRFTSDKAGHTNGWGDSYWLPNDLLKIGQLYLNEGVWNGSRIVSKEWIEKSSTEQVRLAGGAEAYGYKWWIPNELEGLYEGRGRGDQRLVVYPKENLVVVMTGTGFDPGALGGFIIRSIQSRGALAPHPDEFAALQSKLVEIQRPPEPETTVYLPKLAKEISGKTIVFQSNAFGLTHFQVSAFDTSSAFIILSLNIPRSEEFGERRIPLGMNGPYKISDATRFQTPMAARAAWQSENQIEIDYNDFSNNHKYRIDIRFEGEMADWRMYDEAGFGDTIRLMGQTKK